MEPIFIACITYDWLQNHCFLSVKSMTSNLVVVVSVLLPICCHIGCGMPYLCIFVEQVVTLLGAITDNLSVVVISSLAMTR